MTLLEHLHRLNRLRTEGLPPYLKNICLITSSARMPEVPGLLEGHPQIKPRIIALLDEEAPAGRHSMTLHGREEHIPLVGVGMLPAYPNLDFVFYPHSEESFHSTFWILHRRLASYGVRNFHVVAPEAEPKSPPASFDPAFFSKNMDALEEIYQLLADDDSREVYAARVKAIITGDAAFLPVYAHQEYYHPLVHPEQGEILADGGVSDMVGSQKQFAEAVGEAGLVLGFEPMPYMYESAREELRVFPQYRLFCLGLGEKKEKARFVDRHDGSRVSAETENTVECQMTDLDSFLAEQKIPRLDCLKLDVEGSELAALKGAQRTIRRDRPKLIVCLYHKNEDLIELPRFIKSLAPEYELYITHTSLRMLDTILYARAPGQKRA